MICNPK